MSQRVGLFLRARFSPEGLFGLHLTIGSAALIGSAWLFTSTAAVLGLCTAASTVLLWKRWWYGLLALALVVPGGVLLNLVLKMAFARARPGWGDVDLLGYSFPSGHTMTATLLYGLLGALFVFGVKSWWWRTVTVALVFVIVGAVGFSRIYLGAHYFSDVVAAFAAGAAWLAICLTAVETLKRHRHLKERRMSTTVQTGV